MSIQTWHRDDIALHDVLGIWSRKNNKLFWQLCRKSLAGRVKCSVKYLSHYKHKIIGTVGNCSLVLTACMQ